MAHEGDQTADSILIFTLELCVYLTEILTHKYIRIESYLFFLIIIASLMRQDFPFNKIKILIIALYGSFTRPVISDNKNHRKRKDLKLQLM